MRKLILALVAAALCAGCANSRPQPFTSHFDEAEYEPFNRQGGGAIEGQAFLVAKGGDVKYGAGRVVALNPATTYSTEWYERSVIGYQPLEESDPRVKPYSKSVLANGEGRFRFDGLPAGEYYLVCWINWYVTEYQQSGGIAYAKVKVEEGKTTEAVVTRR